MPFLTALYYGQLSGSAEAEWGRVGAALNEAVPDLEMTWEDIPPARKLFYSRADMLALPPPGNIMTNRKNEAIYPDEGLVLLVGKSGSLKSFVTLYHAYTMAQSGKRVAMILMEGFRGYRQRIVAHEEHQQVRGDEEWLGNLGYFDGNAIRELPLDLAFDVPRTSLDQVKEPFNPHQIDVAFIDTFRRAASIENENNNAEVGAVLQRAQQIAPTVVLVHHTRKNDTDTYAGAGALATNTHTHIVISYDKATRLVKMVCENTKDDRLFSDTYYKVAGVKDSIALSEVDEDAVQGARARATAAQSSARQREKDAGYMAVLERIGKATWADFSEELSESERTVKRWIARAEKNHLIQKAGKRGRLQEWEAKTRIPF